MKATNYATLLIKSFEQLRLNSYLCPAGVWTLNSISKCNNWDVDDKIIDNFIVMN